MKKILFLIAFVVALAASCKKESSSDSVADGKFSLRFATSTTITDSTLYAIISVKQFNGDTIFKDRLLVINKTASGYISDSVVLPKGSYEVASLLIFNSSLTCIYTSPLQTSAKGSSGFNLPFGFDIFPGLNIKFSPSLTTLVPTNVPTDFGYSSFTFPKDVIKFKLATWDFTTQSLLIFNKSKLQIKTQAFACVQNLTDNINTISLPNLNTSFDFRFIQAGHDTVAVTYPIDTLLKHTTIPLLVYMKPKQ
jgi:hypothetical protein